MKAVLRKFIFLLICFIPLIINAQETQPKGDKAPASSRAQRKKAKQKWKESRKLEMDQQKAVKEHHKRIQTKETRKRMRREKRRSEKLRANKKEAGIIRWFKYR